MEAWIHGMIPRGRQRFSLGLFFSALVNQRQQHLLLGDGTVYRTAGEVIWRKTRELAAVAFIYVAVAFLLIR